MPVPCLKTTFQERHLSSTRIVPHELESYSVDTGMTPRNISHPYDENHAITKHREYAKAGIRLSSQYSYPAYGTERLPTVTLRSLCKQTCQSHYDNRQPLLIGNLDFDFISIRFRDLRIGVLYNFLGLIIRFFQKITLSSFIGRCLLGILQSRCSI